LGELDHPDSPVINLKNVSHNIREIYWEGDDVCGTVEILSTPSGNILRELLKNNIRLGISSRGMGSVKPMRENTVMVQDDFELIGFDFVSNPSTHGAFLSPTGMNESVQKEIEECGKFCKAQDFKIREIVSSETPAEKRETDITLSLSAYHLKPIVKVFQRLNTYSASILRQYSMFTLLYNAGFNEAVFPVGLLSGELNQERYHKHDYLIYPKLECDFKMGFPSKSFG
jgi:hypothetical protein